ncbi:MAG: flagellar hook-length control protein FliK [Lachnospiraceae bacterium]|nr:flagellar hook-length control protein FliK [Lachnospiraceae bacterium]
MIMPISTSGIGNVDLSSSASKAKSKAEEKAMDAFASLMNMTAGVSNDTPTDVASELDTTSTSEISETSKSAEYEVKDDVYKNEELEEADIKESYDTKQVEDSKTVDNTKEDANVKDEGIDTAVKVLTELKNIVMEKLDITEEELDGLLESMGIELVDLLDVNVFKDFVLTTQNATNVDLLINEDLSTLVNDLTKDLENLINTYDIQDVPELINFVKENIEDIEKVMNVSFEEVVDSDIPKVDVEIEDSKEVVADNKDAKTVVSLDNSNESENVSDASKTSTDSQSNSEGYQPQAKETPQNLIVNNLNQAVNNAFATNGLDAVPSYATPVSEADIVRQIIDEIRVNVTKDTTSMEVQLNPEHLGKVQINVASKDGIITAQIITENEAAKHAIENSIAVLKETFNNQELKVEAVEVMIASYEFFNQGQDAQFENEEQANASRTTGDINLNEGLIEDELTDEEQLQVEVMRKQGSSVNYTI